MIPNSLKNQPVIKNISSLKLTVICLTVLVILIVWGTIYQAENGLYQAQQKFFHSWIFFIFGFLPFPGTNLIMFVLFVNLVAALVFRIGFSWRKSGNLLIHLGILVLLTGGFISSQTSIESVLTLKEGSETSLSSAYHDWEVAVWEDRAKEESVYAFNITGLKTGRTIDLAPLGITLRTAAVYKNCQAFVRQQSAPQENIVNSSGIVMLKSRPGEKKPARNAPGLIFTIPHPAGFNKQILLFANDPQPTRVTLNEKNLVFYLRKRRYMLPFSIKLLDFKKVMYPGSNIVKSYESRVEIKGEHISREVRISMNKPLRYNNYALYQSQYFVDRQGNEYTVLAVVKNAARLFPYFASGIIFLGMLVHFIMALFPGSRKRKNE